LLFRTSIKVVLSIVLIGFFWGCSTKKYVYSEGDYTSGKINNSANMHRATMQPYTVMGKTYYPTRVSIGDSFSGIASWYGPSFHNKLTSNGEYYNMYAMTAAHKTFPMNTVVKVTNLENGRSAVVRINDRGPFVKNRIIDLSNAAARKIDMIKKGTAPVRIEVIGFNGVIGKQSVTKSIVLKDYFVQIGAFRKKDGAQRYASRYSLVDGRYRSGIKKGYKDGYALYRVYLKGFRSENEARDFISRGKFFGSFILRE